MADALLAKTMPETLPNQPPVLIIPLRFQIVLIRIHAHKILGILNYQCRPLIKNFQMLCQYRFVFILVYFG